jgi:hypothetical protein
LVFFISFKENSELKKTIESVDNMAINTSKLTFVAIPNCVFTIYSFAIILKLENEKTPKSIKL